MLSSDLDQAGIRQIQNVEFTFHVFDTDTYDTIFDSDTIRVATSLDGTEEQAVDDSGVMLVDQDGVKITVKEVDSTTSSGARISIFM